MRASLSLLLLLLVLHVESAQSAESDLQQWTVLTATGFFAKESPWRWYAEVQPRIGDDIQHIERLLLRPALGYQIAPGIVAWAGYGWTPLFLNGNLEPEFIDEHRIFQQLTIDQPGQLFHINHRLRLEQRFIEGVSEVSNRLRYLIRGTSELGITEDGIPYGATAYSETFVNLNTTNAPVQGFDRERIFLGPYLKYGPLRAEFGYLGEFGVRRNNEERMISTIALALNFGF